MYVGVILLGIKFLEHNTPKTVLISFIVSSMFPNDGDNLTVR